MRAGVTNNGESPIQEGTPKVTDIRIGLSGGLGGPWSPREVFTEFNHCNLSTIA